MFKAIKKLLYLLPAKDKGKLLLLLGMMILGAILEVIGIGMLPVFVSIIATPDRVLQIGMLQPVWNFLEIKNGGDLLIWGSAGLITVFFMKNIYMILYYYVESRFIHNRFAYLGAELYKQYMKAPFTFHLARNSSVLLRNITQEIQFMLMQVMKPSLIIATDIVMITVIVVFLLIMEPIISIVAMTFLGITGYLFLKVLKTKMHFYGKQSQIDRQLMIQDVQEGVGGIKEVTVLKREDFYISRFKKNIRSYATSQAFRTVASRSGKPVMETLAIACMLIIAITLYIQGRGLEVVLPVLTLFAAATVRLLPSTQEMINAINQIRYYVYSIEPIYNDIRELSGIEQCSPALADNPFKGWSELRMNNVTYQYPDSDEKALREITLSISKGSAVGFIGASGAGKTTVVDILLGLLKPDEGSITTGDKNIFAHIVNWQETVGYIPQTIFLADDTIRRNIALGMPDHEIDEEQLFEAIKTAQLGSLIKDLDKGVDTIIGEAGVRLSGGQRQRIGIARALYHNPEILIMDEATSALDNITEKFIIEAVERLRGEQTIIMIAHRLTTVQKCDQLFILEHGKLVNSGTYSELVKKSQKFREMAMEN